ncbi:MAG: serine/threonine protein kinase [Deltaproteobacteria bacterium]|nr:serine/threonine protein kinase [Deltaproteobacteria bacterium]
MAILDRDGGETFSCALCGEEHPGFVKMCPTTGKKLRTVHKMLGKIVDDKYVVRRFIAEGGMGAVYEGANRDIGRKVAIKFLHRSISENPQYLTQFENEARIAASLGHRNIVDVLDMGVTASGMFYLVMEFLQGDGLSDLLEKTVRLPYPWAADITIQILEALSEVHAVSVVHRDLKPENVLLVHQRDGSMTVKILDFGVSCLGRRGRLDRESSTGTVIGTPLYMSAEQAMGLPINHRSDLYSVGVMLYEMLSGSYPFVAEDPHEILKKIVYEKPMPLGKHAVTVPPGLEAVVMWAIAREQEERFADADEFIDALLPFRDPEPSGTVEPAVAARERPAAPALIDIHDIATPVTAPDAVTMDARPATSWQVDVQGIPAGSDVYVDDVLMPGRPITLPCRPGERAFRIEAEGHETWERIVDLHADVVIFADLRAKPR